MRIIALLLLSSLAFSSFATQVVEWKKRPIKIVLPVGKERIIRLPDNVIVGVPSSIRPLLRVQPAQGYVYLTAREEFSESRLQLKMHKTGEILLIDVSTTRENATVEDIVINLPTTKSQAQAQTQQRATAPTLQTATPIELTRFAALKFYAPERLAISDPRIRISKAPNINLDNLFTGKSFGIFEAKAEAVFRTGKLYLTAIKLVNTSPEKQTVPYTTDINADFLYATPQHLQVSMFNVPGDTTVLYLITDKPLEAALYHPIAMTGVRG